MAKLSDEIILAVLHKSRYEVKNIDPALRRESGEWLSARKLKRVTGEYVCEDRLPQ